MAADDHRMYCRATQDVLEEVDKNMYPADLVVPEDEDKEFDSILIDAVKSYPHLYDTSCKDYRDAVKKENSWLEISKVLYVTPEICVNRWTRLRESYSKEKKKRLIETKSGSGASKRRGFTYFESMKFIEKFVKSRSVINNVKPKRKSSDSSYTCTYGKVPREAENSNRVEISNEGAEKRGAFDSFHHAAPSTSFQDTEFGTLHEKIDVENGHSFNDTSTDTSPSTIHLDSPLTSPTIHTPNNDATISSKMTINSKLKSNSQSQKKKNRK